MTTMGDAKVLGPWTSDAMGWHRDGPAGHGRESIAYASFGKHTWSVRGSPGGHASDLATAQREADAAARALGWRLAEDAPCSACGGGGLRSGPCALCGKTAPLRWLHVEGGEPVREVITAGWPPRKVGERLVATTRTGRVRLTAEQAERAFPGYRTDRAAWNRDVALTIDGEPADATYRVVGHWPNSSHAGGCDVDLVALHASPAKPTGIRWTCACPGGREMMTKPHTRGALLISSCGICLATLRVTDEKAWFDNPLTGERREVTVTNGRVEYRCHCGNVSLDPTCDACPSVFLNTATPTEPATPEQVRAIVDTIKAWKTAHAVVAPPRPDRYRCAQCSHTAATPPTVAGRAYCGTCGRWDPVDTWARPVVAKAPEVPQRERDRRAIDALLREDAKAHPAFARARFAAVMAQGEHGIYGKPLNPNHVEGTLAVLHGHEANERTRERLARIQDRPGTALAIYERERSRGAL